MAGVQMISAVSLFIIILGLCMMRCKEPVQFLANVKARPKIGDVKRYNRTMGKTFIVFGILLFFICLPAVTGRQNSWGGIVTTFLAIPWVIGLFICCVKIEEKYKKKS